MRGEIKDKTCGRPETGGQAVDTFGNAKQILHSWYENMQAINLKSETC
jgi:hypothetical protein